MERTGGRSGVHFLRTNAGIPSSPQVFWVSTLETMDGIMLISLSKYFVLAGKSGKDFPEVSRVEMEENFRTKHSVLSAVGLIFKLTKERRFGGFTLV